MKTVGISSCKVKATGLQAYMQEILSKSEDRAQNSRKRILPMGICTSSGKIGHSLSFGKADAVVILLKGYCIG